MMRYSAFIFLLFGNGFEFYFFLHVSVGLAPKHVLDGRMGEKYHSLAVKIAFRVKHMPVPRHGQALPRVL